MFVLNQNTLMDLARWPNNIDGDRFTLNSKRSQGGSGPGNSGFLLSNEIPNLPWENGGNLFFYGDRPGSGWLTWRAPITAASSGRVDFQSAFTVDFILKAHPPRDGGDFFLEGIKEAIDYQNEWYFDRNTKELFVQVPGGNTPAVGSIRVSRRENTININRKNYIEIGNLAVLGGTVVMNGSNNRLYQVSSFYGGMTRGSDARSFSTNVASIYIGYNGGGFFQGNIIEKCEIAFADASGIRVVGENTLIKNNYIHDCGYLGNYDAPILARDGRQTNILNNVITRAGRDAIQTINRNSEIAFNDVSHSNLISDDCALIYTINKNLNLDIHHNWFHDSEGRGKLKKAAGIYLDNDATNVNVYNNVVWNVEWTAIQMNWNIIDVNVYNNTLVKAKGGAMGAWHRAGTAFSNVNVWNNLADVETVDDPGTQEDEGTFERDSDKRNNIITQAGFVNYAENDFFLTPGSSAVNAGIEIPGITDGFVGIAPDVGAYELGVPQWKPGIDWAISDGPANRCYNLPGENCFKGDIASSNFKILTTGETCPKAKNGSILVTSVLSVTFTAELKNEADSSLNKTIDFTNNLNLNDLPAGNYNLCIKKSTDDVNFEQCFDLIVGASQFVEVATTVDSSAKQLNIKLEGSESYKVELNGELFFTSDSNMTLDLKEGENTLLVNGDKVCQGSYSEKIVIDSFKLYPNPVISNLTIETNSIEINNLFIYSISGEVIKSKNINNKSKVDVDLSDLPSGVYFASINNDKKIKLIKQ